uniref:Dehydrogenase/reductase (SDR family) member 7Cb n=1 Tax=Hippocampus comes TaxID=109280 RepID=A0A3Q2XB66_HIPCM
MVFPSVMALPLLIVLAAGLYYIYNEVMQYMSKSLVRNKVVVITDAVSGVGNECAHLFHKGGARLILCGDNWDKLESLYDSLINEADPSETFAPKLVILDFSDMESMEDVTTEMVDSYGCVDVLICNSSMKLKAPVQSISLELDRNIMDINYFGPTTLTKGGVACFQQKDRCVLSLHQSDAASKHAVQAFFDCLRAEVEEYGITVSTISHTFIDSTVPSSPEKHLAHGVRPSVLADEIMRTVNRKRKEVVLSHPIPRVAVHLRSLLPSFLFAVLGAGVKDSVLAEQME